MKNIHKIHDFLFGVLLTVTLTGHGLRASDSPADTTHEAQYPSPEVILAQTRAAYVSDADIEQPQYSTQISFLNHEGEEKVIWGPTGYYDADIMIHRYFGTESERQKMISRGSMDDTAKLYVPCFDCDSSPSANRSPDDEPQVDLVYLNGHYLGRLKGVDRTVTMNTFDVPVEFLNFPSRPGESAKNHLRILVDTANDHQVWYLGQLWQMLVVEAPPPVLLVHGWTRDQEAMEEFSRHLSESLGIPSVFVDVSADDSPYTNAAQLQEDLEHLTGLWGVEQFNIVAHSKGGLDSRVLVDQNGLQSQQVFKVMQVATPNRGSLFADAALSPVGKKQQLYSWAAETFENATQESQSFTSLTIENCIRFNELHHSPICPLHTITGRVDPEDLSMTYRALAKFVDLGDANDGMVAVSSAHAIHTQISGSPLYAENTSRYDHSGIIREGAPEVIQAYADKLEEKPDTEYDLPPYYDVQFQGTTTRGEALEGVDEKALPPNASLETDVIGLEMGKIHDCEIRILSEGETTVGIFPCSPGTQAEVISLGGNTAFPMVASVLPAFMADNAEILTVELPHALPGVYRLRIDCTKAEGNALAKVLVKEEKPVFTVEMTVEEQVPPSSNPRITASCFYRGECVTGEGMQMVLRGIRPYENAMIPLEMSMHDDGVNGDAVAQDGIYSVEFQPSEFGRWNLEVEATGEFDGMRLTRFANASVVVTDATGSFTPPLVETTDFPIGALQLPAFTFTSEVTVNQAGRYCLTADLVTPDGSVVGNAGTQWNAVGPECQTRILEFSTKEVIARKEDGPWTVQNLRLSLIGDEAHMEEPIPLAQSDFTQQTKEAKYSEIAKYDFKIQILGTGSERVFVNAATLSQNLEVRMDAAVTGTPPESLSFQIQVQSVVGDSGGFAEGELVQTADGYQLVACLDSNAIQSQEERNSYILEGCQAIFYDEDGFFHEMTIDGCYRTQEYPCATFHNPSNTRIYKNEESLKIDFEDTPDEDGFYKAILQYTEPDCESENPEKKELLPSDDESSLLKQSMFYACLPGSSVDAFHLKEGSYLTISGAFGEYADITESVQQQLWLVGNCDGVLDSGETLEIIVYYRRGSCWVELSEIVNRLAFCIAEYETAEKTERHDYVLHPFDTNADLSISYEELETGRQSWLQGSVHPRLLLEGLELSLAKQYFFDEDTREFYPYYTSW